MCFSNSATRSGLCQQNEHVHYHKYAIRHVAKAYGASGKVYASLLAPAKGLHLPEQVGTPQTAEG